MENYRLHVISHSHWDREWYQPFENFRIRLVCMIDKLMDYLDHEPEYVSFMLDGHTALLEDYLAIKPQNRQRLAHYIAQNKILIGPWYILPDEVLITGESHLRNYYAGDAICKEFHAKMNVGYMPDAFGHPSQMPQILKKLGLEEIVFWRGLSSAITKTEFIWDGKDDSQILGIHLLYGYGNAPHLPDQRQEFLDRIWKLVQHYAPSSTTNLIPVMNGRDHLEAQECVIDMIRQSQNEPGLEILHSNLPNFVKELKQKVSRQTLEHFKGEMRSSDKTLLLGGTLSSRMYLKQENFAQCGLYEKWVEPMSVMDAFCCGTKCPRELIRQGWKYLLLNAPHDSICGCSVDEVHEEMMVRYHCARQIGEELLERAFVGITGREGRDGLVRDDENWIYVFNSLPYRRNAVVRCEVDFYPQMYNQLNYAHLNQREYTPYQHQNQPFPRSIIVEDFEGRRVQACLLSARIADTLRLSNEEQPKEFKVHRYEIVFQADHLPACGFRPYRVIPSDIAEVDLASEVDCTLENDWLRVFIQDGKICILDKQDGTCYYNCAQLVDGADCGDEYTYSYTEEDREVEPEITSVTACRSLNNGLLQKLEYRGVMRLPVGVVDGDRCRSEETVACPFCMEITLETLSRRVDFKIRFENHADNHRLRVLFPAGLLTEESYAANAFSIDRHEIRRAQDQMGTEKFGTDCQKEFVSVAAGACGITVFNKGLPEYELVNTNGQSRIAVTLLRCVDNLSKEAFPTRTGDAGWSRPTPGAQCHGTHVFEVSFMPNHGNMENLAKYALEYTTPVRVYQNDVRRMPQHAESSFMELCGNNMIFSALKMAEQEDSAVLRFYHAADQKGTAELKLGVQIKEAYLCDLREIPICKLTIQDARNIIIPVGPWEIVTVKLVPA